ncbi:MAG: MFS transporter, partial [Myxococcota bacterium]
TLVVLARTLPVFVLSPLFGALIDRVDRRRLLIASDGLRAASALGMALSYACGSLTGLYLCIVIMMCCAGAAIPCQHAVLPMLVPRSRLPMANALFGGTWAAMAALGAAAGGVATEYLGISAALVADAATFLISLAIMVKLPALPPTAAATRTEGSNKPDGNPDSDQDSDAPARGQTDRGSVGMAACLAYLLGRPRIAAIVLVKPLLQVLGGLLTFLPLHAAALSTQADHMEQPGTTAALALGLLFAGRGLGCILGTWLLRRMDSEDTRTMGRLIVGCYALIAACYAVLAGADGLVLATLAVTGVGLGHSAAWMLSSTLLQLESDRRFHGRIFSFEFGLATLLMAGSSVAAGALLDSGVALPAVTALFAAVAGAPALLWLVGTRGHAALRRWSAGDHPGARPRPLSSVLLSGVVLRRIIQSRPSCDQ